ncbi:hypothetical protein D9Q98_007885 [Chlorella vulgaris]|uniref:Uncharacterized protein n=1 Tax=Chlorella vulgaris TaxID=3077 RepID=A0A9D4THM6_CHLVU|nr:hypothetical protein D9Q98_007885 [Chlorella vulgaris]
MGSKGSKKGPPLLTAIALNRLVSSITSVHSLTSPSSGAVLPEELCCSLFEAVLAQGKLTPKVLELFERTEHELLTERIAGMGIRRWTPPRLPSTQNGWLGYSRPPWE